MATEVRDTNADFMLHHRRSRTKVENRARLSEMWGAGRPSPIQRKRKKNKNTCLDFIILVGGRHAVLNDIGISDLFVWNSWGAGILVTPMAKGRSWMPERHTPNWGILHSTKSVYFTAGHVESPPARFKSHAWPHWGPLSCFWTLLDKKHSHTKSFTISQFFNWLDFHYIRTNCWFIFQQFLREAFHKQLWTRRKTCGMKKKLALILSHFCVLFNEKMKGGRDKENKK